MNPHNFFFNQQGFPFNPQQTSQSYSNQGFDPMAAFGLSGHPGFAQGFQNGNIHINNHTNINNNVYGGQPNPYNVNVNINPNNQSWQNKAGQSSQKNNDMSQAENNPNSAHYYKRIGNEYFKRGLYQQAIENYTKAIEMNDTESIFYSNRARCYKQLKQFEKAYEDAKVAVELDDKNIKAHLLSGQILAELGKLEEGFDRLNKALNKFTKTLNYCDTPEKKEFEKEIQKNIARVKKVIWLKQQAIKKQKQVSTLNELKKLVNEGGSMEDEDATKNYQEIMSSIEDPITPTLNDIPDDLCCKITMDFMHDPVMTSSGITYERSALTEHFGRNGNFDPVTRDKVDPKYVFPNKAIKAACEDFLKKNPWAFEFQDNENYLDVKF